jgi:hypothetical protein
VASAASWERAASRVWSAHPQELSTRTTSAPPTQHGPRLPASMPSLAGGAAPSAAPPGLARGLWGASSGPLGSSYYYYYAETSGGSTGKEFGMDYVAPCAVASVTFKYNMYGNQMGTISVSSSSGVSAWSKSGDQGSLLSCVVMAIHRLVKLQLCLVG